jgi:hypothetical protein
MLQRVAEDRRVAHSSRETSHFWETSGQSYRGNEGEREKLGDVGEASGDLV